jgi:hypothetical protein
MYIYTHIHLSSLDNFVIYYDVGVESGLLPCIQAGRMKKHLALYTSAYVSIRQHTAAYVSIRQHTAAYGSIRQDTSAYVSIRQHTG